MRQITHRRWFWPVVIAAVILLPLLADWALATGRIDQVHFDYTIDPPNVVADGKSAATITLRVTENGVPDCKVCVNVSSHPPSALLSKPPRFMNRRPFPKGIS